MESCAIVSYLRHILISHAKLEDIIYWWWNYGIFILPVVLPIIIIVLSPFLTLLEAYIIGLYLKAYRYFKSKFQEFTPESWEGVRKQAAHLYWAQGRFWHGYEIKGVENIPSNGPALIVVYHGFLPMDCCYLISNTILLQNRMIYSISERIVFKIPGMDALYDCFHLHPGTVDYCADKLKKGNLMIITPGGTREALFADERYQMLWEKRVGFAKAAFKAKVPIIPMFTRNIREAFPTFNFGKSFFRRIHEKFGLPIPLFFGGFPVKLTTFIGEPIPYDPTSSAEEMAEKAAQSMQNLISLHQPVPGSIVRGVKERIQHFLNREHP